VKYSDWFRVRVAKAGYVRVSVDNAAAPAIEPVVCLYDQKQEMLGYWEARVHHGPLYLRVYDDRDNEEAAGLLKGTVEFYAETDASEINDDFKSAREAKVNTPVNFAIMPVGDVDVFKLTVPESGYLRVNVNNAAAPHVDCVVQIFDKDQRKLGDNEAHVEAGQVLVRIAEYRNDESSPKDLATRFEFYPENDASEPNHGFTRAREVELNKPLPFALMPRGDRDTFKMSIPATGYLRVTVDKSAAAHVDPVIKIHDREQVQTGWDEARVQAGTVYVDITEYNNDESAPESLSATMHFQPETDDSEGNNTIPVARDAPLNKRVEFALMPKGDRDAFRLAIPEAGSLRVQVDNSAARHVDPVIEIYDHNQRKTGGTEARLAKGHAYVVISEYGNDESAFEALGATFHFFPETDKTESNDTIARARPVALGQPVGFALMPYGDRDVFKLAVKQAGTLKVAVDKSAARHVDPVVRIYDRRERKIGDAEAFVIPGDVYVLVEEYGNDESSPAELKASFAFTAAPADDPRLSIPGEAVETPLAGTPKLALTKEQPRRVYRLAIPEPGLLVPAVKWESENPPQVALHIFSEQLDYLGADKAAVAKGNVFVVASVNPAHIKTPPAGTISFTHTPSNDPHEPDGSFPDARTVRLGAEAEFTLSPVGDRDFFRCQVEKTGYLQVRVDKTAANHLDPWVAIYNEDRLQIGKDNARVQPGTVYIHIGDSYDDEASENKIKAAFEFTPETDGSEPNGGFAEARAVQPNSAVDLCLMPTGDRDYFRLETDKPGYLRVTVDRSAAPHLDPWAHIYDERQNLLGNNGARVPAGVLYVVIGDSYDDECSPKQIQAQFVFTPYPDSGEPDDRFVRARDVTAGEPVDVFLMPDTDQDFFKLSVPGPGALHVRLDGSRAKGLMPDTAIYNRHQEKIGQNGARVDAGTAYVLVTNAAQGQIVTEPVRATLVYLPDAPPAGRVHKPGDTIEVSLPQEGAIRTAAFRVSDPCYLSALALFPPPSIAELAIELVGPSGEVVRPGGPPIHEPGIYHLLVHAKKGRSATPIAVRVDAVEPLDTFEPNDRLEQATEVKLPFDGWVCLHRAPHVDWFRFAAVASGLYCIRVDHPQLNPGAQFMLQPADRPDKALAIPAALHRGQFYTALYARLEAGRYQLSVTGSATTDGNANPVLLSVGALNTGERPPGDLKIMAFGLAEDSADYRTLTNLSRMVRTPVSSGDEAEDIARELREAVSKKEETSPKRTTQTASVSAGWPTIVGVLLVVIAMFIAIVLYRKSH